MKKFFWWAITVAGVSILCWVCSLLIESRGALNWPQTKGQAVSSLLTITHLPKFIDTSDDPMRWYGTDVQYEYSVGYMAYSSNRVSFRDEGVRGPKTALKVMNKYRHHHDVTVYYNPANPKEAVLEPSNIGDILTPLMVGGLLALVGLFFLFEQFSEFKIQGAENHLHWGNIYQKQRKFDQALNEFNKIVEISPNLAQGYKSRGSLYLQQGKWDLAIADFNQAISIDPIDALVYFNRANAYVGQKQYDKALGSMQKAMELGFKVKPEILEEIKKGLP
jgi:tetratricopeptide (TPR) repeat protein